MNSTEISRDLIRGVGYACNILDELPDRKRVVVSVLGASGYRLERQVGDYYLAVALPRS